MALDAAAVQLAAICRDCDEALARLPPRPQRGDAEARAAEAVKRDARAARSRFLRGHADDIYNALTRDRTRPLRAEELVYAAAERFPGLVPSREAVDRERQLLQPCVAGPGAPSVSTLTRGSRSQPNVASSITFTP